MKATEILTKIPNLRYREPTPEHDGEDVLAFERIVRSRRSVRVFTEEIIPDEIVNRCIDLALLAPNSSNLQPWKFIRVVTPEIKAEVIKYCFSQSAARTADTIIVCLASPDSWRENSKEMLRLFEQSTEQVPKVAWDYYQRVAPFMYAQGFLSCFGFIKKLLFTAGGFFKILPREPISYGQMKQWAHKSTALACQNLMLSFRAYGYDTCPMEGFDSKRVKKLLNIKRRDDICMIIAAGKRAPNGVYGPQIRLKRDRFVTTR